MLVTSHIRTGLLAMLLCAPLLCVPSFAMAEADARMHVEVLAEKHAVKVGWLHAHIKKAADLALPTLWYRLVPQEAHALIPEKVKAIRFLQKATPSSDGVSITFHKKRVLRFLQKNSIPYYATQSARMPEPQQPAAQAAPEQDVSKPVALQQLFSPPPAGKLLTIQRQASLPEQVLFEDDLGRDPRIASLKLRQVNREFQQYRLQLKGADEQWLSQWFRRRGLTLSPSVEGWIAH
ncbi:MAG: hypothetical protein ACE5E3_05355 [Mariprofundus sp.]